MSPAIPIVAIIMIFVVFPALLFDFIIRLRKSRPSGADEGEVRKLRHTAARMEARIVTLERLLDEDAPGWRDKVNETTTHAPRGHASPQER